MSTKTDDELKNNTKASTQTSSPVEKFGQSLLKSYVGEPQDDDSKKNKQQTKAKQDGSMTALEEKTLEQVDVLIHVRRKQGVAAASKAIGGIKDYLGNKNQPTENSAETSAMSDQSSSTASDQSSSTKSSALESGGLEKIPLKPLKKLATDLLFGKEDSTSESEQKAETESTTEKILETSKELILKTLNPTPLKPGDMDPLGAMTSVLKNIESTTTESQSLTTPKSNS